MSAAATILDASSKSLAQWIVDRQTQLAPSIAQRYEGATEGESLADWATDTRSRLSVLAEALTFDAPALFENEVGWARAAFEARGVPLEDLRGNLSAMREVLGERLPQHDRARALAIVDRGLAALAVSSGAEECLLAPGGHYSKTPLATLAKEYLLDLLDCKRDQACERVLAKARSGVPVEDLYRWVLEPAMIEIGRMWLAGEASVADEHYATAATELVMSKLHTAAGAVPKNGKMLVAGAVGGDLHAIGIRMVSDLFELHGWSSHYLGANSPGFAMQEAVERAQPALVAISTKLTHHLRIAAGVIRDIRMGEHGKRVPILVGGMPFCLDHSLAGKVGADGWAPSAWDAVAVGERLAANR